MLLIILLFLLPLSGDAGGLIKAGCPTILMLTNERRIIVACLKCIETAHLEIDLLGRNSPALPLLPTDYLIQPRQCLCLLGFLGFLYDQLIFECM
jgi:hypothetical protein